MEWLWSSVELGFGPILGKLGKVVVELPPSGLSPLLTVHVLQWETMACPPVASFLVGLLFIVRLVQSVWSRLHIRREVQLAKALATQSEEKCQLTDKLSTAREECARIQSSLADARHKKELLNIPGLMDAYRKGTMGYWMLRQEITSLVHELKEERSKRSRQEEETTEMLKTLKSLEEVVKIATSQGAFPNLPGGQELISPGGPLPRSGSGSYSSSAVPSSLLGPPHLPAVRSASTSTSTRGSLRPVDVGEPLPVLKFLLHPMLHPAVSSCLDNPSKCKELRLPGTRQEMRDSEQSQNVWILSQWQ